MFERYTEKARRLIFFARYEASRYGSHYIDTEHLLLGLMREDRPLMSSVIGSGTSSETVRQEVEKRIQRGERFSTAAEVPLSVESKRVLNLAAEKPKDWQSGMLAPSVCYLDCCARKMRLLQ